MTISRIGPKQNIWQFLNYHCNQIVSDSIITIAQFYTKLSINACQKIFLYKKVFHMAFSDNQPS